MSIKRISVALALAVAVGAAAWALTFITTPQQPEVHILAGTATTTPQGPALQYTEDHPYYTVTIVYPEAGIGSEQTTIEQALKGELNDYTGSVADLDPSMMPSLSEGYKLALDIEYQKFTGAGGTTSYLFLIYEDTGGAHPNHYYDSFIFTSAGKTLGLGDLFNVASSTYLARLSSAATTQVTAQLAERLGGDPTGALFSDGLAPTADNFQNFVLDGSTLKLYFPPYQVAAYAAGDFEADIPLSQLGDILNPAFK